jgi:uncharacterized membrane protein YgdD (TMEM256/DUF423 family)
MIWIKIASIFMFLGVALGAFGAHALKGKVDPYLLDVFKTGVLYHMVHALGLFAVAWLSTLVPADPKIFWAGILMVLGILLFSGSLYIICLSGVRAFGAITPLGGLCFLAAWGLLFLSRI